MDPFVFMLFLLGFALLMLKSVPGSQAMKCPDCNGPYGHHFPRCKRVKK